MKLPRLPAHFDDFVPKLVVCLRDYTPRTLAADVLAGVTVGLVALPLAMAFAIASGMPPQAGIYGAIVAGFLISALGGSRTQIGGPTGAFVVVVAGIVAKHGVDGLFMCTLMAGVLLMAMGLTGLGTAVDYIPRPVVIGFTNGIAVLIASTQLRDFFGLQVGHVPGEFLARLHVIWSGRATWAPQATALAVGTLAVIALMRRLSPRIPGVVVALVAGTAVTWMAGLGVETIGSRFGGIPTGLPHIVVPHFRPDLILPLLAPTVAVAMLGAIESLLSAVVADHMSGDKHNPNVELFAQGVANVCSPLVGGLPATGAIARTATNIRMGGRTPVSGIVHALTLLALLLVASPLAQHVPLAVLAGILMVVAYNMGAWSETREILKLSKADVSVWLITFVLTVLADLEVAVQAGMILAGLLYIRRVTATTSVSRVTPEYVAAGFPHSLQTNAMPDGVAVYRIHGPFLFGSTEKLEIVDEELPTLPQVVVLRLRNMTAIDGTGLHALERLADRVHATGRVLVLCGMRDQPERLMARAKFHEHIGAENIQPSLEAAVVRARALLARA